jgi:hypothetical protein
METLWPDSITRLVEQQTEDLQRKHTRLTAERSAIDDQISTIERELEELQTAVRVYRRFSDRTPPARLHESEAPATPDMTATDSRTNGTLGRLDGMTIAEAAEKALAFLGGSAATGELRDLLVNRGALRDNRNAYGYMLKIMREKPERFTNVERGRWALRKEPTLTR